MQEGNIHLDDQQRIAVAEEAVPLFHREIVDIHGQIMARKSTGQHEHGALGAVEIRDQRIGRSKLVGREDKLACPAVGGLHTVIRNSRTFHGSNHRGAYRDHALLVRLGMVDFVRGIVIEPELLGFHFVFGQIFDFHQTEGSQAHVHGHLSGFNAFDFHALE